MVTDARVEQLQRVTYVFSRYVQVQKEPCGGGHIKPSELTHSVSSWVKVVWEGLVYFRKSIKD